MIRQIQERSFGSAAIPLFLFQDANGTVSSYYTLSLMGRDVYAIADPCMEIDRFEMPCGEGSSTLCSYKKLVSEGRILVGGKMYMVSYDHETIDRKPRLVVGWHDCTPSRMDLRTRSSSSCGWCDHGGQSPDYCHVVNLDSGLLVSEDRSAASMNKLEKRILQSVNMLHKWQPHVWQRKRQPRTVMLRATEYMMNGDHPTLSFVDQFRDSPTLGWDERSESVVVDKSYPVQGHHFGIFKPKNVSDISPFELKQLLRVLSLYRSLLSPIH
jgi:hypothetical protein